MSLKFFSSLMDLWEFNIIDGLIAVPTWWYYHGGYMTTIYLWITGEIRLRILSLSLFIIFLSTARCKFCIKLPHVRLGSMKLSVTRTLPFTLLPVTHLEKNSPEKGGTCNTGIDIPGVLNRTVSLYISLLLLFLLFYSHSTRAYIKYIKYV